MSDTRAAIQFESEVDTTIEISMDNALAGSCQRVVVLDMCPPIRETGSRTVRTKIGCGVLVGIHEGRNLLVGIAGSQPSHRCRNAVTHSLNSIFSSSTSSAVLIVFAFWAFHLR
jgi:hypothetical protein